jgi:hypothetical protein
MTDRKAAELIPLPNSLSKVRELLGKLGDWKWGQTKMLNRNRHRDIGISLYNKTVINKRVLGVRFRLTFDVYVANVRPVFDGNHPWNGIVPFPNFEPGQFSNSCLDVSKSGSASTAQSALRPEDFRRRSSPTEGRPLSAPRWACAAHRPR